MRMNEMPHTSRTIPISLTLATSIGLLVAIAVGAVFWIQWSTAQRNTLDLVTDRANLYADQILSNLEHQLEPARHLSEFVAGQIERGELDPLDTTRFETALANSLAAVPQILSVSYIDTGLQSNIARRHKDETVRVERVDRSGVENVIRAFHQTEKATKGFWGDVVFVDEFTLVNHRRPLRRGGEFIGILAVTISVSKVSELIEQFTKSNGGTGFILYGRDRVLAHSTLKSAHPEQSPDNPLVSMTTISDKVLNALAVPLSDPQNKGTLFADRFERRVVEIGGNQFATFVQWIDTYGDTKWGVGAWLNFRDVDIAKRRILIAGYVGIALFLLSLVAAVVVGKSVARPVQRLTNSTTRIGEFDLSEINDLPPSWIKELDQQATAFNTMLSALRSFETYVPKTLVNRLIKKGGSNAVESREKDLTVMFTDIVGFTSMSEGQPAKDIADMINDHLAILGRCVEEEGGTIDKYIGDALMAFLGGPDDQPDTPERAARAALAMCSALEADNNARKEKGLFPIRIRVGLHQGPVLVGNIGAPGRVNYTIIGDTVNTCARIEALGKQFDDGADATILVSGLIARQLTSEFNVEFAGNVEVKGKEERVEIHRLKS